MIKSKRTPVFYDEIEHVNAMGKGYEAAKIFDKAKADLETILETNITDYAAFKNDILGYSLTAIQAKFPKAYELGMSTDNVLKMLSIDIRPLKEADAQLKNNPCKFVVCAKSGKSNADEKKDDFIRYAETDEQHERLEFANEIAKVLERAAELTPYVNKSDVTLGLTHLVYFDVQTGNIIPNHYYVLNGIK